MPITTGGIVFTGIDAPTRTDARQAKHLTLHFPLHLSLRILVFVPSALAPFHRRREPDGKAGGHTLASHITRVTVAAWHKRAHPTTRITHSYRCVDKAQPTVPTPQNHTQLTQPHKPSLSDHAHQYRTRKHTSFNCFLRNEYILALGSQLVWYEL